MAGFCGVGKRLAFDVFHYQEGEAVLFAYVEDWDYAGVREASGGAGFAIEAFAIFGALRAAQGDQMDCF